MSVKQAIERLVPIAWNKGHDDYRRGIHKSQNPYSKGNEPSPIELIRAWDNGHGDAKKQHLALRGQQDGNAEES